MRARENARDVWLGDAFGGAFYSLTGEVYNVRAFKAVGDGITDDTAAIAATFAAASAGGSVLFPPGTYKITSSVSSAAGVQVRFHGAAVLSIAAAATVTIGGSILAGDQQIFSGSGSVRLTQTQRVRVRWFGARGDDTGDDGPAIQRAITAAQASANSTVELGSGTFRMSTGVSITGANQGITIVGNTWSSLKQGSAAANSEIHWVGGASAVITSGVSYTRFIGFAITQDGTATYGILCTTGGDNEFRDLVFQRGQAGTAPHFSTAAIGFTNGLAYVTIVRCQWFCSTGVLVQGGASTCLTIRDCLYDSQSNTAKPFIKLSHAMDVLRIEDNTFNIESTDCIVFDNTSVAAEVLSCLIYQGNEFDSNVSTPDARLLKCKNVGHASIIGNHVAGQGNLNPLVELTNSRATICGNHFVSIVSGFARTLDTSSYVFVGPNFVTAANVASILTPTSQANIVNVSVSGGAARIHAELTNPQAETLFLITPPNNGAFEIQAAYSADGDAGFSTVGQIWTVIVKNTTGGALGAIAFNAAEFNLATAWVNPANGFQRSKRFYFNGTKFIELLPGSDVAN